MMEALKRPVSHWGWAEKFRRRPEKPDLWVFNTCVNFLRTVPTLQRDDNRPDDVDTDQEDHSADACRYACNSTERKMVEGQRIIG